MLLPAALTSGAKNLHASPVVAAKAWTMVKPADNTKGTISGIKLGRFTGMADADFNK